MKRTFAGVVVALVCLPGCFGGHEWLTKSHSNYHPPTGQARQVQAMWTNHVVVTPDVANNGKPLVGLAGQLYFFGEEVGFPLACKGTVVVDAQEFLPGGDVKMLERWEIDPVTFQKLGRKDRVGWGYVLFLPWSTYRPDLTRIQLQVKFVPESGVPLFSSPEAVSFAPDGPPVVSSNVVPAAGLKR